MKNNKQLDTCVFYFFNEFEVKIKKNKIHKIVQNSFFIQNELTNQQKLLKLHNTKQHFYLCENTSELKITQIYEDDRKITNTYTNQDDTILLEFQDRKLIYFKNYLKSLASSTKYILTIINSYKHLLNSIQLLVTNNIFHNHINFDSIVIDNSDYQLLSNLSNFC
jgi:hypothetical protein